MAVTAGANTPDRVPAFSDEAVQLWHDLWAKVERSQKTDQRLRDRCNAAEQRLFRMRADRNRLRRIAREVLSQPDRCGYCAAHLDPPRDYCDDTCRNRQEASYR